MKTYVDAAKLQEYTTKLVAKLRTIFTGTPQPAATVADMTDHDKLYVYTGSETGYTAGNLYYWNGTAWTSGGVYNSAVIATDTTLSVSGKAADGKATGDAIAAAKAAVLAEIAPAYSSSGTYAVGDYVIYNSGLYRCVSAISTAESWTAAHWVSVDLAPDLGGQVSDLKTQITDAFEWSTGAKNFTFVWGKYLVTNGTTVDFTDERTSEDPTFGYSVMDCQSGDEFVLNTTGGSSNRAWAFVDSSNNVISNASVSTTTEDLHITAPANSSKIVIHGYKTQYSLMVNNLKERVEKNESRSARDENTFLNEYLETIYPETEIGGINTSTGSNESDTNYTRTTGYIDSSKLASLYIGTHSGSFYVYRYKYIDGAYTFVDYNQIVGSGEQSNYITTMEGTHFRFRWAGVTDIYNWLTIKLKTNLYSSLAENRTDINNLKESSDYVSVLSRGNTVYTSNDYTKAIIPGHFYKLLLQYWPRSNVSTSGAGVLFEYGYVINDVFTQLRRMYQFETLESEYLAYIPEGLTNPTLRIGGRINAGEIAIVNVIDITNNLPDYVNEMISDINTALTAHQTSNSISFPFITDIHVGSDDINSGVLWAMLMSAKAIDEINKKNPLDLCVLNGDYLNNSTGTTKATAISWYKGLNKVLENSNIPQWRGKGNHDVNDIATDSTQHLTAEDYYKYFMKNADINAFDMKYGDIEKCYGYYDDKNRKIRIVLINTVDVPSGYSVQHTKGISNEQLNFIADALKFTEQDWGIVFVSHHALQDNEYINPNHSEDEYLTPEHGGTPLMGVINAFINKTTYNYTSSTQDWTYNITVDYTNNGSDEVICMLSGHSHADRMATVGNYVMMAVTSAGITVGGKDSSGSTISKTLYSKTETSWDIITIDRLNKMIYADRYGGGNSRSAQYGS